MAKVIQIIEATNEDENLVNGAWHAVVSYPYPHTVCGVQLEGEDGVVSSPEIEGRVTCHVCQSTIIEIKSIRNWRPRLTPRSPDKGGRRL